MGKIGGRGLKPLKNIKENEPIKNEQRSMNQSENSKGAWLTRKGEGLLTCCVGELATIQVFRSTAPGYEEGRGERGRQETDKGKCVRLLHIHSYILLHTCVKSF